MFKTKDLKVTFLGITPVLRDETGYLKPQDIVALSALMTFKGKSVKDLYAEAKEKGQDIEKKVKTIIRKSSLRGHASIATTPAICFTYEASKFVDSLMTGMVFSSSLMASGRRTDTTIEDIVYPSSIDKSKEAKIIYKKASEENINFLNNLLSQGIGKDDASKVLQYGIYGTGIIAYPIESVIAFKKEIESQGDWMPEEAKMMVSEIEKKLKEYGVDLIYASRELAARNTLPYPNIFKDPAKTNLAREYVKKNGISDEFIDVIDFNATVTPGLEKAAGEIYKKTKETAVDKETIKNSWRKLLDLRHDLMRDFSTALNIKLLSSVSWRVWSEKKRHRTTQMTPDSLYYSIDRARVVFEKMRKKITNRKLNVEDLQKIDRVFTIPPVIKPSNDQLYGYLDRIINSLDIYYELIEKHDIKPSDAIFVMPRGVRVDIIQNYDLYNLIGGYYTLRTCSTAEVQLRQMTLIEMVKIKATLVKNGLSNLAKIMVTKCHIPGFCLEEKNCQVIKGLVKDYDETFHEEMKAQLDEEFDQNLSKLK